MINDHRIIGTELKLFFFDEMSPGSCFFLPKGAHIYNKLVDFLRLCYKNLGYKEVITPNIYDKNLWKVSGHWDKYKENMFLIGKNDSLCDEQVNENDKKIEFSLKPMNCPGHCLMFKHLSFSYRDLPIRWADFGVLHRNELSGALTGLTRVRRFQQDDAHIFCTIDQVEQEIENYLVFLKTVYEHFGFKFFVELSTRPDKFIGTIENWDKAEEILKNKIKKIPKWKINEGDGAFYGPKIDVKIKDSLKRFHQLGTIQLDFNLPERFGLKYVTQNETYETPVLIHRAILGSVERFIAILLEHTSGKLPFWLSPRQICIIPISNVFLDYAGEIYKFFKQYNTYIDDSTDTLNKKIRKAEKLKFNYIFVIGEKEKEAKTINIRVRKKILGVKSILETIEICKNESNLMDLFR